MNARGLYLAGGTIAAAGLVILLVAGAAPQGAGDKEDIAQLRKGLTALSQELKELKESKAKLEEDNTKLREYLSKLSKDHVALSSEFKKTADAASKRIAGAEGRLSNAESNLWKVAAFEEVFGTDGIGRGRNIPREGTSWVRDERWGQQVLAVLPFPVDCTNEIISLTHLSAEPANGNQVRIHATAVPGRKILIRIRFFVIYR